MKITAIRHGQTEGNVAHIVQSRTGGVLTKLGITQAKLTAEKLKDEHFDVVYCSDMQRCLDTARYVLKYHPNLEVVVSESLRELSKGIFEGRKWEDLPDFAAREDSVDMKTEGGESWQDVDVRLRLFINQLHETHRNMSILFVTHNGTMKVLASILENKPLMKSVFQEFDNGNYGQWVMDSPVAMEYVR